MHTGTCDIGTLQDMELQLGEWNFPYFIPDEEKQDGVPTCNPNPSLHLRSGSIVFSV